MAERSDDRGKKQKRVHPRQGALDELLAGWRRAVEVAGGLDRLHSQLAQAAEAGERLSAPVVQAIRAAGRQYALVQQTAEAMHGQFARLWQTADAALRQVGDVVGRVREWWAEFERRFEVSAEMAAPILARYKWVVTPSLPFTFVLSVLQVGGMQGRRGREINRLFIEYFSGDGWRRLRQMVHGWEDISLFKKRMGILRDCVRALQAGEKTRFNSANAVLPTLIAQIDGVLTDYLGWKGVPWDTSYEDHVRGKQVVKVGRKSQFSRYKTAVLYAPLEEVASFVLLDVLLQRALPGQALGTPFNFSRHKIMHGENVRYGRKDYVIRAFLVLDYLAYLE